MIVDHTLGAILNGGGSRRMGSPKADLEYSGIRLIDHVIATMSLVVTEIVVCGNGPGLSVPVIPDRRSGIGPLAGLESALVHGDGRPVLVCAVDLPLVSAELLRRLIDPPISGAGARVAQSSDDGLLQPLCASYGPDVAGILSDYLASGRRSVHGLLDALDVEYVETDPFTLTNVNEPDDFDALP